jgi:5'-3' exonuclease
MTNLIFDLSNIAHRSMFVISNYGAKSFTFDSQNEIDQLMRKLAIDVAFIIRLINPSRVIFALDDKSWRRSIKIDENDGYKANRTKSSFINWDNVYKALDEFAEIMQNYGMIVTKIKNAEADDVCSLWSYELQFNQNQHVIIVSGDEDLRQLVQFYPYDAPNKKFAFTTVFNPFMQGKNASRKLYVPKYFEEWMNTTSSVDLFNMKDAINVDKEDFKKIISGEKTKMEIIDGRMIALRKMFCGDDGDNIPAIYTWLNEKGVEVRITNSKFEKIYEMLVKNNPSELMDHYDLLERSKEVMEALTKVIKQKPTFTDIHDRLERQIKLVVLDKEFFPEEITKKFEEVKQIELDKPRINYANLNMYNLLEGTKYVNERKVENESPIFKEFDNMNNNNLF